MGLDLLADKIIKLEESSKSFYNKIKKIDPSLTEKYILNNSYMVSKKRGSMLILFNDEKGIEVPLLTVSEFKSKFKPGNLIVWLNYMDSSEEFNKRKCNIDCCSIVPDKNGISMEDADLNFEHYLNIFLEEKDKNEPSVLLTIYLPKKI